MYCGKCGQEIPGEVNYCVHCGAKVYRKNADNKTGKRLKKINTKSNKPDREKTSNNSSSKKALMIALAVTLPIMIGAVLLIKSPSGTLQGTFRISEIEPSEEALETNYIAVPMIEDMGINAEVYEEAGFGSMDPEEARRSALGPERRDAIQLHLKRDGTFAIIFYDSEATGEYYYDKTSGTISLFIDDEEVQATYDGEQIILFSDDGSRFIFR